MTNEEIKKICEELYKLDPSLRGKEEELKKILLALEGAKPGAEPDAAFLARLREEVLATRPIRRVSVWSYLSANFRLAAAPLALGALLLVALTAIRPGTPGLDGPVFETLRPGAFGSIASVSAGDHGGMGGDAFEARSTAPEAAMGGGSDAVAGKGGDISMPSPLHPPGEFTQVKFVYKGEPIEIPEGSMDVFRRVKGSVAAGDLARRLQNVNLAGLDLGSFSGADLQSFTLVQDRAFGYMVTVNAREGTVDIHQNWERWDHPAKMCQDDMCFRAQQLRPENVLPDPRLLQIADSFLREHGISRQGYGEPVVMNEWRIMMDGPGVPEEVSVVYPFEPQGRTVYDEGGNPTGLTVSVNMRHQRVSGVWGLTSQRYEKSAYAVETDPERILRLAENGSWMGGIVRPMIGMPEGVTVQTVEAELDTPRQVLLRVWNARGMQSEELYVPALLFPVKDMPANQHVWQKAVVIPLVKELLDQAASPMGMGRG